MDVLLCTADPEQRASSGLDSMMAEMLVILRSIEDKLETMAGRRENRSGGEPE